VTDPEPQLPEGVSSEPERSERSSDHDPNEGSARLRWAIDAAKVVLSAIIRGVVDAILGREWRGGV
jgi:hypothetical protein